MSVNEKMTALANQVRRITGITEKLGIDEMVDKMSSMTGLSEIDRNSLLTKIIERTVTEITADDLTGVGVIRARAFASCDKLETVTLTDAIRAIGAAAFQYCTSLTNIDLCNVIDVETQAFQYCNALEEAVLPDTVGWVGAMAFADCPNLKRVVWSAKAPDLYGYCFGSCHSMEYIDFSNCLKVAELASGINPIDELPNTCVFYVPVGLINTWRNASNWSTFYYQIDAKSEVSGRWNITFQDDGFASFKVSFTYNGKNYNSMVADYDTYGDWCLFFDDEEIALRQGDNIIVDFGTEPQLAPKSFTDFLAQRATRLD